MLVSYPVCLHLVGQVPGGQVGCEEGAGGLVAVTELAALSAGEGDLVTPAPSPGGHNAGGGIFHPPTFRLVPKLFSSQVAVAKNIIFWNVNYRCKPI